MFYFLLFTLFFSSNLQAGDNSVLMQKKESRQFCERVETVIPPFASSYKYAQKDKAFENIRESTEPKSKVISHLPLRSIVKIRPEAIKNLTKYLETSIKNTKGSKNWKDSKKVMIPIEVAHPNKVLLEQLSKKESRGLHTIDMKKFIPKKMNIAQEGARGYVNALSLDFFKNQKYIYRLSQSAPDFFYRGKYLNDKVIYLKKFYDNKDEINKYNAEYCCSKSAAGDQTCYFRDYVFIAEDFEEGNTFEFSLDEVQSISKQDLTSFLRAIPKNYYKVLMKTLLTLRSDPTFNDDMGFSKSQLLLAEDIAVKRRSLNSNGYNEDTLLKIPLFEEEKYFDINAKITKTIQHGPFSSYHYSPMGSNKDESNDEWGKPLAVCAFINTLKKWDDEVCYGRDHCKVGFGHIYHPESLNVHTSHERGECFDVRPFNSNIKEKYHPSFYQHNGYDRVTTRKFIKLLGDQGASNIYYNDPKIYKENRKVRRVPGHDNHIHFCFPTKSEKTISACLDYQEKQAEKEDLFVTSGI